MENYEQSNLRFWPLESMARFGQNPFGENLWRIVHAPSRRSLVHGERRKPKWLPTYPQAGSCWVLEKWLSAYEFAKCTAEVWNQSMTILGPYPSRGEYEAVHIFEAAVPADANLDKLISWVDAGKRYSANENRNALRDEWDRDELGRKNHRLDVIRNALPAFGAAPMSGPGGGRGTKTMPILRSANELGLPVGRGHVSAKTTKQKVDVGELIEA